MRIARTGARIVVYLLLGIQVAFSISLLVIQQTDHRLLTVTSGSMQPLYAAGDAVLLDEAARADPAAGDVITYRTGTGPDDLVTHRVVSLHTVQGDPYVRTQGDANEAPDPDLTPVAAIVGQPVWHLPYGGHATLFLLSPLGRLLTYGPVLVLLLCTEVGVIRRLIAARPRIAGRHAADRKRRSAAETDLPTVGVDREDGLLADLFPQESDTATADRPLVHPVA